MCFPKVFHATFLKTNQSCFFLCVLLRFIPGLKILVLAIIQFWYGHKSLVPCTYKMKTCLTYNGIGGGGCECGSKCELFGEWRNCWTLMNSYFFSSWCSSKYALLSLFIRATRFYTNAQGGQIPFSAKTCRVYHFIPVLQWSLFFPFLPFLPVSSLLFLTQSHWCFR